MNRFMEILQAKLMPIAVKVGNQRFLVALRDSFVSTMPVVMAGSIAILLNAFLVDFPTQFGITGISETFAWLVAINGLIAKGSITIVSLIFIYCLGVNIAKVYKTDTLSAGIVALSAFVISLGNSLTTTLALANPDKVDLAALFEGVVGVEVQDNNLLVTASGVLPFNQLGSRGYFTAILVGFIASVIFCKLMNKNWTIKLPDSVPPAIAKPFLSIIPAVVTLYVVAGVSHLITASTGQLLTDLIYKLLQTPLLGLSQNFFTVIFVAFIIQLFWFFGLHGGNVMAPIMEGVFGVALIANMEAFQNGDPIPYVWTNVSYGSFVWYATLGLLIAIFWQSKNKHYQEVAKLGIVPVLFNIGEPVNYGLPTVLNPILFIPKVLCPVLMAGIAYTATSMGLVSPVTNNVTWVMPPVLYGFFSTGFDWRSIILSLVNLAVATLIYLPFVKMADKQAELEAAQLSEQA